MGFKLMQNSGHDFPVMTCDICDGRIFDMFGDLVSGSRVNGGLGNLVVHHKTCATSEPLHLSIRDFFALLADCGGLGDKSSDGVTVKITLESPANRGFDEHNNN